MSRSFTIGQTTIDDDSPAYVIAELGSSGEANTELTKRFITAAAIAGASAVKLQKRSNESLFTRSALDAPYNGPNSFGATYGEHRAALEYSADQLAELRNFAWGLDLDFGVTAFDCASAELLVRSIGVDFLKIASACVTDTVLLEHCARLGVPMVLSTGTGTQHDVDLAVETITAQGCPLALLQCTAVYPLTDPSLLNLRVIETYRARYPELVTGLSTHFPGTIDIEAAYALGGRVFEKHFTLDRRMRGADHAFSLEPAMLRDMVDRLGVIRAALGSRSKERLPQEAMAIAKMGHSLVAARSLPAGHTLTRDDIAIKSPGGGIPPSRLAEFAGRTLPAALDADQQLPEIGWYQ